MLRAVGLSDGAADSVTGGYSSRTQGPELLDAGGYGSAGEGAGAAGVSEPGEDGAVHAAGHVIGVPVPAEVAAAAEAVAAPDAENVEDAEVGAEATPGYTHASEPAPAPGPEMPWANEPARVPEPDAPWAGEPAPPTSDPDAQWATEPARTPEPDAQWMTEPAHAQGPEMPWATGELRAAVERLLAAVRAGGLPLEVPGVERARRAQGEVVQVLDDAVLRRLRAPRGPLLVAVG